VTSLPSNSAMRRCMCSAYLVDGGLNLRCGRAVRDVLRPCSCTTVNKSQRPSPRSSPRPSPRRHHARAHVRADVRADAGCNTSKPKPEPTLEPTVEPTPESTSDPTPELRVESCSLFDFADKGPGSFRGGSPWAAGRVTARERESSRLGVSPGRGLRRAL